MSTWGRNNKNGNGEKWIRGEKERRKNGNVV
jgi:hypothetical protein